MLSQPAALPAQPPLGTATHSQHSHPRATSTHVIHTSASCKQFQMCNIFCFPLPIAGPGASLPANPGTQTPGPPHDRHPRPSPPHMRTTPQTETAVATGPAPLRPSPPNPTQLLPLPLAQIPTSTPTHTTTLATHHPPPHPPRKHPSFSPTLHMRCTSLRQDPTRIPNTVWRLAVASPPLPSPHPRILQITEARTSRPTRNR